MPIADIQATEIFERNYYSKARIVVNRGGTRSGKTYGLQQMWMLKSFEKKNKNYLVGAQTWPQLRLTAYQDFKDILDTNNLWKYFDHKETYHVFTNKVTNSKIHYLSTESQQKIRGVKFDDFELTEANNIEFNVFRQLLFRCPGQCYLDFNPSEEDVWINTEIEQKRDDIEVIQSSYRDNPFLEPEIVKEIEYLRDTDPMYWNIFGLGEYGELKHKVYSNWDIIDDKGYENAPSNDIFYGGDFGFVNPTAMWEIKYYNDTLYLKELCYQTYEEPVSVIDNAHRLNGTNNNNPQYYDSADPAKIEQLYQLGYNANKSDKKVKEGIDFVRRFKLKIARSSVNGIKEIKNYKYQEDKNGVILDQPVKFNDHLMDAMRYAIFTHLHGTVFF